MNKQKELIECIRREEFGIGVALQGEARKVVDNMARKYKNLLSTVAEDLNSKESHFILELIQNADDNSYRTEVDPSLSFMLVDDLLVVTNNEVGFEEKNVRALCSAAESSKKSEKRKGYIGEKGIGFKSIFKVTDSPEIHSNGFHFRFDRSNPEDLLGYVVPHWHEPEIKLTEQTTLVIPAKPSHPFSTATLSEVSDSLLLFLQQLRRLDVETVDGRSSYLRQDRGDITTLVTKKPGEATVSQDFLRKTLKVDMSDIHEIKREGVQETEIILALPLGESGEAAPIPGCATYAFLPIRDFGFNFYIQADFILASSREAIHEELAWNVRLRDAISTAFVDAVEEFKHRPEFGMSFLKYLPTKEEVHDKFFSQVVDQLIKKLKVTECIPVAGGGWKKPTEVSTATGKIRELFPSEDCLRIFGVDYFRDGFALPPSPRDKLGFKNLMTTDVASVFIKHLDWIRSRPLEWKARFYAYLALDAHRMSMVKLLGKIPCLPLEGGEFACPSESVFFPLSAGKKYGFEHELSILDTELLRQAVGISEDVQKFFCELGAKQDSPFDLIRSHILKLHAGHSWQKSDHQALIGHVRYIKDKFSQYLAAVVVKGQQESAGIALLRDGLYIGTKNKTDESWTFSRLSELYLGEEFKPEFDLENLLGHGASPELFVSPDYMKMSRKGASAEDIAEWREFFARIGTNISPKVLKRESGNVDCSEELTMLLKSETPSVRRATLEALDRNWTKYPSNTKYRAKPGRYSYDYDTGLVSALKAVAAPTRKKVKVNLSAAYADNDETRAVLRDSVVFVEADLRNSDFLEACGITYKVDAAACLKRLRQIKADDVRSRDQVARIYRCLESLWDKERATIESSFSGEELIRVGKGDSARWVLPSEACWKQTGNRYLDRLHPSLDSSYQDFHGFFVKKLRVPEALSVENWVEALKCLDEIDEPERQEFAFSIYRKLNSVIDTNNKSGGQLFKPDWLDDLDTYSLLLNRRGEMVGTSEHFYADDRPEISRLFEDEEDVSFFNVSVNQIPSVSALLGALDISCISQVVMVQVSEEIEGTLNNRLTAKIREMLVPIARIVYGQSHASFEEGIKNGSFNFLSKADVLDVELLTLTVTLGEWTREMSGQSASRLNEIFLSSETRSKHDYVAIEVEKLLLRQRRGASAHIGRTLMATDEYDANEYLEIQKIPELPDDELESLLISIGREVKLEFERIEEGVGDFEEDEELDVTSSRKMVELLEEFLDKRDTDSVFESSFNEDGSHSPHDSNDLPRRPSGVSNQPEAGIINSETRAQPSDSAASAEEGHQSSGETLAIGTAPGVSKSNRLDERSRLNQRPGTTSGRLLSYAEPKTSKEDTEVDGSGSLVEHKKAVERAAVEFFKAAAASQWRRVEEMPANNPGFDFFAEAFDGNHEFVEVKGQSGAWTEEGVALTPTELLAAARHGEHYWLCVVEYALDDERRRLWLVQNLFGKTDQFRFDRGWRDVAESSTESLMRPDVGLFVTIPELGKAKILEVVGNGMLARLKVELEDKRILTKVFIPAIMKVSAG